MDYKTTSEKSNADAATLRAGSTVNPLLTGLVRFLARRAAEHDFNNRVAKNTKRKP